MSQFGLLLVTDEPTIRAACRGWVEPLSEASTRIETNPFTGEPLEIVTRIPEGVDESLDCAAVDEVRAALKLAQPVCIDFQSHRGLRASFLDAAEPYLIGFEDMGAVMVELIPDELSEKVAEHFGEQLGAYADAATRRRNNYSLFVFIYDF